MNLHRAFQVFMSHFAVQQQTIANQKIEEFALSENLDVFLGVEEDCKPGEVHYFTSHGFRIFDPERSYLNQFVVAKKGRGFSKGRGLPYIYRKKTTWMPPQLIVRFPTEEAAAAGYAEAISLPYTVAGVAHNYPEGTLTGEVYIQHIDMLDTEYAAMLENLPRF